MRFKCQGTIYRSLNSNSSSNAVSKSVPVYKWNLTFKNIFSRFRIREEIRSDNVPQFSSDAFKKFANGYDFIHKTSSPKFPQSNGQAERAVGIVKNILQKN